MSNLTATIICIICAVVIFLSIMFSPVEGHSDSAHYQGNWLYILRADRPYKVQRLKMQDYSYIGVGKVCVRLLNGKEWCQLDDGNAIWLNGSYVSDKWLIKEYKFLWDDEAK